VHTDNSTADRAKLLRNLRNLGTPQSTERDVQTEAQSTVRGRCLASASRYRDPRPRPRGLVPKLGSSRARTYDL